MQPNQQGSDDRLMLPPEVAALFRVDARTIGRWMDRGRLRGTRTPGGHRRIWQSSVYALLEDEPLSHPPLTHPAYRNPAVTAGDL